MHAGYARHANFKRGVPSRASKERENTQYRPCATRIHQEGAMHAGYARHANFERGVPSRASKERENTQDIATSPPHLCLDPLTLNP